MENNKKDLRPRNGDGENNINSKTLRRKRIVAISSLVIAIGLMIWFSFLVADVIS
jgi:hypothetical protein